LLFKRIFFAKIRGNAPCPKMTSLNTSAKVGKPFSSGVARGGQVGQVTLDAIGLAPT